MNRLEKILSFPLTRWLWSALYITVLCLTLTHYDRSVVNVSVSTLLPQSSQQADYSSLLKSLSQNAAGQIFVLIRAPRWDDATQAAAYAKDALRRSSVALQETDARQLRETVALYAPYRENFITAQDAAWLASASEKSLQTRALRHLYRPFSKEGIAWADDPLGLFSSWLSEFFDSNRFTYRDGHLVVLETRPGQPALEWIVLTGSTEQALTVNDSAPLSQAMAALDTDLQQLWPSAQMLSSGIALISEQIAKQAAFESAAIGTVSLLAITLIVWFFFRRLAPIVQAVVTLGTSFVFSFCTVVLVFGEIHLITLVFGATLLGIAVDYVFHFLCATHHGLTPAQARTRLSTDLFLSLLSTLVAYALMAFAPMPGLQQMAIFCIAGLSATFLTVFCFFPLFGQAREPTALAHRTAELLKKIPRLTFSTKQSLLLAAAALFFVCGLFRLHTANELVLLNSIPAAAFEQQTRITRLLNPTSPGQFFVVQADTHEQALQTLEALTPMLDQARRDGVINDFVTPSRWLSSQRRQQLTADAVHRANEKARGAVALKLKLTLPPTTATATAPLTFGPWHEAAATRAFHSLWIDRNPSVGVIAVVTLSGVTPQSLPALNSLGSGLKGVHFVNSTAQITQLLASYRNMLGLLLLLSVGIVGCVLAVLYGRLSWRLICPTLLGGIITLGSLGWFGVPFSLFTILPMVLLLGLGIDYAILLFSNPQSNSVWCSILLAGTSTLLSFGLLCFSSTAALHQFGLTVLIGIGCIWCLTPLFRPKSG